MQDGEGEEWGLYIVDVRIVGWWCFHITVAADGADGRFLTMHWGLESLLCRDCALAPPFTCGERVLYVEREVRGRGLETNACNRSRR